MENMENMNVEMNNTEEQELHSETEVIAAEEQGLLSGTAVFAINEEDPAAGSGELDFGFGEGQLSLFGPDPEEEAKKVAAGKGKGPVSTTAPAKVGKTPKAPVAPPKPKLEKVLFSEPWTVHYSGTTFIVTNLFEEEIADGNTEATLDEIRQKLATAEGCVELTEARCKWDADEELKQLYPVAFGTSKGCC